MWLESPPATSQPRFSRSLNWSLIMTLFDLGHRMKLVTDCIEGARYFPKLRACGI